MSFIAKLKRRNVFRTALAYAVTAWLLIEVMELITDAFEAPPWVLKVFISIMVVGIVPVMVFSWLYEITPDGIRREGTGDVQHTEATTRRLNIAVIIMLALAIGLFGWQAFRSQPAPTPTPASVMTAQPAPAPGAEGPPMVAVLPFTSASLEGESDFFATGVHDDLLTQLAKLQSLRVISRTSVLEYKDTVHNIRKIGQQLGADIILEGGVQAAGGRIRINAQLIDARTDEHLWAETYDRELSPVNIFDVQREIALAITSAMNTTLTDQDNQQLTVIPTENMAAYRAYRRAMTIRQDRVNTRGIADPAYVEALQEAVALDPSFVRARAELAGALALGNVGRVKPDVELAREVEQHLEQIRAIAPGSAEYLYAQAYYIYYILQDWNHAHDVVTQALARNPSDIAMLELKGWIERRQVRMDARTETLRELARLDPRNPNWTRSLIFNFFLIHDYDAAVAELKNMPTYDDELAWAHALMALREDGDFQRFQNTMQALYQDRESEASVELWLAHWLNRDYAPPARYLESVDPKTLVIGDRYSHDGWMGLFNYWLMRDQDKLQVFIEQARNVLAKRQDESGALDTIGIHVLQALVHAAQGERAASLQVIREWRDLAAADPTNILLNGPKVCWILGMLDATGEAVECLRIGMTEPSFTMPFLDPYLPFFDAMRETPEFRELMADVEAGKFDPDGG